MLSALNLVHHLTISNLRAVDMFVLRRIADMMHMHDGCALRVPSLALDDWSVSDKDLSVALSRLSLSCLPGRLRLSCGYIGPASLNTIIQLSSHITHVQLAEVDFESDQLASSLFTAVLRCDVPRHLSVSEMEMASDSYSALVSLLHGVSSRPSTTHHLAPNLSKPFRLASRAYL